ncbi:MAG: hypothetical protein ABFS41_20335, partial [Myxococcota bacterium]
SLGLRALACVAPVALACASPVALVEGRWHATEGDVSVADLAALEPGWERSAFDGPLLAFEAPDGARASWLRRCPGATAPARAEGRALLMSLEGVEVRAERAVPLAGSEAWLLEASALEAGRTVAVKAVTRAAAGCTDDFLLVTPADLATHEAAFDRWWASYREGG